MWRRMLTDAWFDRNRRLAVSSNLTCQRVSADGLLLLSRSKITPEGVPITSHLIGFLSLPTNRGPPARLSITLIALDRRRIVKSPTLHRCPVSLDSISVISSAVSVTTFMLTLHSIDHYISNPVTLTTTRCLSPRTSSPKTRYLDHYPTVVYPLGTLRRSTFHRTSYL